MAGIMDMIMGAQDGNAIQNIASQFGLGENQAASAVKSLLPALTGGLQNNIKQQGGVESLLGALQKGNHQQYIKSPEALKRPEAVAEGNGILGHILGSKDASRQVAAQAAEQSGVDSGVLKKMLPMVATMVMGSVSKQSEGSGLLSQLTGGSAPQASGGGAAQLLSGFLGGGGDSGGGIMDIAKKLF